MSRPHRGTLFAGAALAAALAAWGGRGLVGAAASAGEDPRPAPPRPLYDPDAGKPDPEGHDPVHRTIFHAVLEGLYEDGVPTSLVEVMLEKDPKSRLPLHLVYSCPICDPALDALAVYRARASWHYKGLRNDTFGAGLPADLAEDFRSGDRKRRFTAMQKCVERWIARRLALMRLTEAERDRWQEALVVRRKKGMEAMKSLQASGAYAGQEACPACDGANDAAKPK
jgi:hypothetical protein